MHAHSRVFWRIVRPTTGLKRRARDIAVRIEEESEGVAIIFRWLDSMRRSEKATICPTVHELTRIDQNCPVGNLDRYPASSPCQNFKAGLFGDRQ